MGNKEKQKKMMVLGVYDTETANIHTDDGWHAYQMLYIYNDLTQVDLRHYEPGCQGEVIHYDRKPEQMLARWYELMDNGSRWGIVPVICVYNLMFDLQPLLSFFANDYDCRVAAQSSTHVYTFDLHDKETGEHLLRLWDTYYLNNNGLAAMGVSAGVAKAVGDWDYSLVRTPDTPITEQELGYAARDVQVIPAYLRFLLESNDWLEPEMLGCQVLTKTSLVRQMAKREIGGLKYRSRKGKRYSLYKAFEWFCDKEQAKTYEQMRLRQACFRGGLTFTSAALACVIVQRVFSLDVTSMHHLFINGSFCPQDFREVPLSTLQIVCESITGISRKQVLSGYGKPFPIAVHAKVRFANLRPRSGSVFAHFGIGLLAQGKFHGRVSKIDDERSGDDENRARAEGYIDSATNATFAFGKLMEAETADVFVSEIELFNISRVYEWDDMEVLCGESTSRWCRPPDYITLQSNVLFERKQEAKKINKFLERNGAVPYTDEIADSIPPAIAEALQRGEVTPSFFNGYYNEGVKGQFNGCYGVQAQNVYKPEYMVIEDGEIVLNAATKCTEETFEIPERNTVLYTFGMRIVGGSRMHLVLAMELIFEAFGDRARITGGDTDSLKISCDGDITPEDLLEALEPLHAAARQAIAWTQERVRSTWPDKASSLSQIGEFEVENADHPYPEHVELWNKARVSWDGERVHVTCAGLSRFADPEIYDIEDAINDLSHKHSFAKAMNYAMGYNVEVDNSVCHYLQRSRPHPGDWLEGEVTDYLGNTSQVSAPEAIALYDANRVLGETTKQVNYYNVRYLELKYDRVPELAPRTLKRCPLTGMPFVRDDLSREMLIY